MDKMSHPSIWQVTRRPAMPEPLTFFVKHILIGFGIAALFVAALIYFDISGLRGMLAKEEMWMVAVFVLWLGNGSVFGALQVAYAVMAQAERGD
jgi:hypothetical protein